MLFTINGVGQVVCVKQGKVTEADIVTLSWNIASQWRELGRCLTLQDFVLEVIDAENMSISEKAFQVLRRWKQAKGSAAHYQALGNALERLQRQDLAEEVCFTTDPYSAKQERYKEAFQKALEFGKTKDKRVKIQVIGKDRVGKTSLVRALKGEPVRDKEVSTDGVEMSQPLKNAGKQPWKNAALPKDTTVYHHRVAEYIKSSNLATEQEESVLKSGRRKRRREWKSQSSTTGIRGSSPTILLGEAEKKEEEKKRMPEKIGELMAVPEQERSQDADGMWPVIWDFAGQSLFRAIHPIFMALAAVYVLVFDLTKELSEKAGSKVGEKGNEDVEIHSADNDDTNLDYIMRWLDLVHSFSEDDKTLPAVILVGTHANDPGINPEERMNALKNTFVKSAEIFSDHIKSTFVIDNKTAGQLGEQDPIVSLRLKILNVAKKLPHMEKMVPLRWFEVEDAVYNRVSQGEKYMTRQKFKTELADKICKFEMEEDFEELLQFLHIRGTIVYHGHVDNPDGLVVLDLQWLVEVICRIITAKTQGEEDLKMIRLRKDLGEKGILHADLLDSSCKDQQIEDIQQSLLIIMKKFNLICEWKHEDKRSDYVVPCMLTKKPEGILVNPTLKRHEPVYITFNTNYVPCGLFSRILVFVWEWAASKTNCEEQELFANAAQFVIGENTCAAFVCCKTVIKIYTLVIDESKPVEKDVSSELLCALEKRLDELQKECHWLRAVTWQLCGQCTCKQCPRKVDPWTGKCFRHQEKECSQDDCAHYVPVKRKPFVCNCAGRNHVSPVPQTWVQALQMDARATSQGNATCQEKPVIKRGSPSDKKLEKLSSELLDEWKPLGRRLKVANARLTAFDRENDSYTEKRYKMLLHWKQQHGKKKATYRVLYNALCHELVGRRDLAQDFCCEHCEER